MTETNRIDTLLARAEQDCAGVFKALEQTEEQLTGKVLDLFKKHEVALRHFNPSNGYGYDDSSRDTLEKIVAD